ncbi:MAG: hypothetical protein ABMA15_28605 [Vicinamibacterales bacterium]
MNVSAGAAWRSSGQPLFYAGAYFYRAGTTVFFDGRVMRSAGSDSGVVFYSDVTQEPYSIIYVPIGNGLMQPYERVREGELAGTVGSRTPSFPVDLAIELPDEVQMVPVGADAAWSRFGFGRRSSRSDRRRMVAAPAQTVATAPTDFAAVGVEMFVPPNRQGTFLGPVLGNGILTSPPAGTTSVWVEFEQTRWFSAGAAEVFDAARYTQVGELRGFLVYRDRAAASDRIFVSVTAGGLVAPYQRR